MAKPTKDVPQDPGSVTVRIEVKLPIEGITYSSKTAEVSVTRSDLTTAMAELDQAFDALSSKLSLVKNTEESDKILAETQARLSKANELFRVLQEDPAIAQKIKALTSK